MSKYAELLTLQKSLIVLRLPNFMLHYGHLTWNSKRVSAVCEFYAVKTADRSNYIIGQGFARVGYLESKPGRNLSILKDVAKLRAWMEALKWIPKKQKW